MAGLPAAGANAVAPRAMVSAGTALTAPRCAPACALDEVATSAKLSMTRSRIRDANSTMTVPHIDRPLPLRTEHKGLVRAFAGGKAACGVTSDGAQNLLLHDRARHHNRGDRQPHRAAGEARAGGTRSDDRGQNNSSRHRTRSAYTHGGLGLQS